MRLLDFYNICEICPRAIWTIFQILFNRGLLHNVRKISESDERSGEAKVSICWQSIIFWQKKKFVDKIIQINSSISLGSSMEKLNISTSPLPSPSTNSPFFRPIRNSPTLENAYALQISPEKVSDYSLRPRHLPPGKQLYRPDSRTRKRYC